MSIDPTRSSPLASFSIFADVPAETVQSCDQRCSWRTYQAGEFIVEYLDQTDDVYFLAEGTALVRIYSMQGKAVSYSDMTAGDLFGEYAAIDGGPRSASIEARSRCVIGAMSAASFRKMVESEPHLAIALLGQCVKKIRTLTTRVYEFSTLDVPSRIRSELLRLSRSADQRSGAIRIEPAPTHAEIASRTNTHREAVTRELNRLARAGIVSQKGRALIVNDVDRLEEIVADATGE